MREPSPRKPKALLLNWSKGGISPNANEQRTILVTQNIRYALNSTGCEAERWPFQGLKVVNFSTTLFWLLGDLREDHLRVPFWKSDLKKRNYFLHNILGTFFILFSLWRCTIQISMNNLNVLQETNVPKSSATWLLLHQVTHCCSLCQDFGSGRRDSESLGPVEQGHLASTPKEAHVAMVSLPVLPTSLERPRGQSCANRRHGGIWHWGVRGKTQIFPSFWRATLARPFLKGSSEIWETGNAEKISNCLVMCPPPSVSQQNFGRGLGAVIESSNQGSICSWEKMTRFDSLASTSLFLNV